MKDSHILLIKSYKIKSIPLFRHWYVVYKNIEWHPGTPSGPVYVDTDFYNTGDIHHIYEYCKECADDFLSKNIEKDKKFFLLFYNCDTMLGNSMETIFVMSTVFTAIGALLYKSFIACIICLISLISLVTINYLVQLQPKYSYCRHITPKI